MMTVVMVAYISSVRFPSGVRDTRDPSAWIRKIRHFYVSSPVVVGGSLTSTVLKKFFP
jgi:hypothetical protein